MSIAKAVCPDCGAKLSSPDGFEVGEAVECPKCETEFKVRAPKPTKPQIVEEDEDEAPQPKAKKKRVPEPDDDEDYEDAPRKKKKKRGQRRDDDDEGSYKNSPPRVRG